MAGYYHFTFFIYLICLILYPFTLYFVDVDQAVFQRKLLKELRHDSNGDAVDRFVEGFQEYIEEPAR